jgi:hypothetical protein
LIIAPLQADFQRARARTRLQEFIVCIYNGKCAPSREIMKFNCRLFIALLVLSIFCLPSTSIAKDKDKDSNASGRLLTGRVLDKQDNPVPDAVVYLSDVRSRAVKTYIVGQSGNYDFPALAPNVDYEVYALFRGHKSDTKTVSQFDDRKQLSIILRVDAK